MGSDLNPAPWRVVQGAANSSVVDADDKLVLPNVPHVLAVRVALWRNAEDVMMRRGWNPFRTINMKTMRLDRWKVDGGTDANMERIDNAAWAAREFGAYLESSSTHWPDPFTALVQADCWYAANVEGKVQP